MISIIAIETTTKIPTQIYGYQAENLNPYFGSFSVENGLFQIEGLVD